MLDSPDRACDLGRMWKPIKPEISVACGEKRSKNFFGTADAHVAISIHVMATKSISPADVTLDKLP